MSSSSQCRKERSVNWTFETQLTAIFSIQESSVELTNRKGSQGEQNETNRKVKTKPSPFAFCAFYALPLHSLPHAFLVSFSFPSSIAKSQHYRLFLCLEMLRNYSKNEQ